METLYESGNLKMHPDINLMDQLDLTDEDYEPSSDPGTSFNQNPEPESIHPKDSLSDVCLNLDNNQTRSDDYKRWLQANKIIINTMSEKTSPIIRPLNYTSRTTIPYNSSKDYMPQMHPNIKPKFPLYTIQEWYPDQLNTLNSCKNGASYLFIT